MSTHITLFDKLGPLNSQISIAKAAIKDGVDVKDNTELILDIKRYLKNDLDIGLIHETVSGEFRPSYCEYCREVYGELHRPRFIGLEINMGEDFWEMVRFRLEGNTLRDWTPYKDWRKDAQEQLSKQGFPKESYLFDMIPHRDGTAYAMWCPRCRKTTEFWRDSLQDAEVLFGDRIKRTIKQYWDSREDEE